VLAPDERWTRVKELFERALEQDIKTDNIESPSPFTGTGAKGMGEGGGAPVHTICAAIQNALGPNGAIVDDSHNPPERVWRMLNSDGADRGVSVVSKNREN
jgi:2-furoyl-CoA dehydrogenase large subunit